MKVYFITFIGFPPSLFKTLDDAYIYWKNQIDWQNSNDIDGIDMTLGYLDCDTLEVHTIRRYRG